MSIAMLAATAQICAADSVQHPCAQVRDETDRLACYDQAFGKPADSVPPKVVRESATTPRTKPAAVTAAVTSLERRGDGKFVVTLDNDQTWSQSELNSQADVAVGDTVTVRPAALGSFLLVTKDGIATRVKLVK
jgi:hypothetical protein